MIEASTDDSLGPADCDGCSGKKKAPIACVVYMQPSDRPLAKFVKLVVCQECGRDLANAVGFMCIKDGGWSKLEPRKRRSTP